MSAPILPFPVFDPVALRLGPLEVRWYALAYIGGLLIGWWYATRLVGAERLWAKGQKRPSVQHFDDVIVYATLGVVLGGRLAYVLFYDPMRFLREPWEIPAIWHGGMSFHGGFLGAMAALIYYARRQGVPVLSMLDVAAVVTPVGLFLGRIANFIKPELWGRPTDVPWAMVFPGSDGLPRHPSQLYEAALEGLVLFVMLGLVARAGGFRRPGLIGGLFVAGYAVARIVSEFFREPDPQLGFIAGGFATMGMLLSLPMLAVGIWAISRAYRLPAEQDVEPTPGALPRPEMA
ncbi:MAG: prolipoprotein diacylglyceryl transferase [Beijerinckiaceae bacterium]|nr:prolipoprotein diacylglyceryl transferase [Beijerinckiaceae bacterium]